MQRALDQDRRIHLAFECAFGREPEEAEQAAARRFFERQSDQYPGRTDRLEAAWADFCQMLLASNAFLYVE
jgi:hypothetical protein